MATDDVGSYSAYGFFTLKIYLIEAERVMGLGVGRSFVATGTLYVPECVGAPVSCVNHLLLISFLLRDLSRVYRPISPRGCSVTILAPRGFSARALQDKS